MNQIRRILITRPKGSFQKLKDWCDKNNIDLICQPFIETKSRDIQTLPQTDWIFFSSPNCVRHYMTHYATENKKIAVLGIGTARVLRDYSIEPDFIGPADANPTDIGINFKAVIKENETVLFPISQRSKKTVIDVLPTDLVKAVIVYDTIFLKSQPISSAVDLALFTSPSNFEGYLKNNDVHTSTNWVAFGDTTAKVIREQYPERTVHTLNKSAEAAFITFLEENFSI